MESRRLHTDVLPGHVQRRSTCATKQQHTMGRDQRILLEGLSVEVIHSAWIIS
jgi:hypothetical protein